MSKIDVSPMGKLSSLLDDANTKQTNKALEIDLSSIQEDSEQPRKFFDSKTLEELAASIKERGVKTPISVREDKAQPGKYIINHGARRFRAAAAAGLKTIPAFVDDDYSLLDQLVENIQRDNLTFREIADAIGTMLSRNLKRVEIAKLLGKSGAYVTQYANLLDLPELLTKAVNNGVLTEVTVIKDRSKLIKNHDEEVKQALKGQVEFTRQNLKDLKKFIGNDQNLDDEQVTDDDVEVGTSAKADGAEETGKKTKSKKKLVFTVKHHKGVGTLVLDPELMDNFFGIEDLILSQAIVAFENKSVELVDLKDIVIQKIERM